MYRLCPWLCLFWCTLTTSSQEISCSFDHDECGFVQDKNDELDWTRHSGSDHVGDNGYYMYIEASRKRSGDRARMYRRVFLRGNSCLSFYGRMSGSKRGMGTLKVLLDGRAVFTMRGSHGDEWQHFEEIPLPGKGSKMLVFEGIRGRSYASDIAIDDLLISKCEEPHLHTPTVPSVQVDCTFDSGTCGFIQDKNDKFDWTRRTGSTPSGGAGPSGDHNAKHGYYMYIEATGKHNGDNAKMHRTVLLTGNSCLSFYVRMFGTNEDMGVFKIRLDGHHLFSLHQNYGEHWQHFEGIPLLGKGEKLLVLEGIRGVGPKGDIAIDDIRISNCKGGPLFTPSTPPATTKPVFCGTSSVGRIVGGTNAVHGEWPWQAMLRSSSGIPYCGGTLVSRQWVITAAHCVKATSTTGAVLVRLGAIRRISSVAGEQDFQAAKVIVHPDYNKPKMFANDIALLKLDRPARLNQYVNVACLPDRWLPAPREGQRCWVTGWGRLSSDGPAPDILQQVQVPVVGKSRCSVAYPNMIDASMVCAGSENGGIDSCQGDSGGPMICQGGEFGSFVLQGVTSWGHGCASQGKFGVYAKVKHLIGWIDQETAKNR